MTKQTDKSVNKKTNRLNPVKPSELPYRVIKGVLNRLWLRRELRIYSCTAEQIKTLPNPGLMKRDCFEDLRFYERTDDEQVSSDEYLEVARERQSKGHHLYTRVENNLLIHYGWLIDRQEQGDDAALGQTVFLPPFSAALYDYFTHPVARGRGLYRASLSQVLHDARDIAGAEHGYIYVYAHNRASWSVIEKVGFIYQGSLIKERKLFLTNRYAVSPHGNLDTALLEPDGSIIRSSKPG